MYKKLLSIFIVTILVAVTLVGCGGGGSPCPPTLSILSITEGDVSVMKAGMEDWIEAEIEMELEVGDTIKTGDHSGAEITFFDGSTIELEAGTEIEIVSLDITCDTDVTTITMMQTLGTTVSRVTKLLDPASRYEVETPTGVAAVRGSVMIVQVTEDGITWITNVKGNIWFIAQGVELEIPEGQKCVIRPGQLPMLISLGNLGGGGSNLITTDLAIDKSDCSDPVDSGINFTYTLQITNNGPSNSTGAVVLDALPSDVSFVSATNNGTYDSASHTISWAIGALAKDASTSMNITVKVNESTRAGIITNTAIVDANERDYDPTNDTATEDTTINTAPVNNPPMAEDDAAITNENTPVTIDVLDNDFDIDGDILTVDSVTQGINGSVTKSSSNVTYTPDVGFNGTDSFTYSISDGNGGTDTATVTVTVTAIELPAKINVQIDTGPTASIFIWDNTNGGWATDEDTGLPIDGTHHVTSANIKVAGGHSYCVWVGAPNVIYDVKSRPSGWSISPLGGGGEKACGYAAADTTHPVHFTATN